MIETQQGRADETAEKTYAFFTHTDCAFFPCHETEHPETFNCLFCYCPLYTLGERCGGNYAYTEEGIKDCSACLIPHCRNGYAYVVGRFPELAKLAERSE